MQPEARWTRGSLTPAPRTAGMLGLDTPLKQAIFGLYVGLWVSSHLLVYASKLSPETM